MTAVYVNMYVVFKKYIYKVKELILSKEALTALFTVLLIYLQKQSNTQENLIYRKTA